MDEDVVDEHTSLCTQEDFGNGDEERNSKRSDGVRPGSSSSNESEINMSGGGGVDDRSVIHENDPGTNDNDGREEEEDDDGSSVGSFSSSQSDSSVSSTFSEASLTLMQKQQRNIARNERFLGSLREKYRDQLGTLPLPVQTSKRASLAKKTLENHKANSMLEQDEHVAHSAREQNLGMVMKGTHRLFRVSPLRETNDNAFAPKSKANHEDALLRACQNYASGIRSLEERYPHRKAQIRRLHAILSSTASLTASIPPAVVSSSAASVYIPAPIFCIGSRGTGKTSIVCDVVGVLSSSSSSREAVNSPSLSWPDAKVQPAYVDCSIVEPSTVERLVYTIYKQLKPSHTSLPLQQTSSKPKSASHSKRKRQSAGFPLPPQPSHDENQESDANRPPPTKAQHENDSNQPRVLPSRRAKKAAIHKSLANNATTYQNVQKSRLEGKDWVSDSDEDDDDSDEEAVTTLHSAVLSLGRSLQKHYGSYLDDNGACRNSGFIRKPRCGILVLDKAEELLSLSSASKRGTSASSSGANNYLSELLLLPKIMKLNLTIVVITNYSTLHMTRELVSLLLLLLIKWNKAIASLAAFFIFLESIFLVVLFSKV